MKTSLSLFVLSALLFASCTDFKTSKAPISTLELKEFQSEALTRSVEYYVYQPAGIEASDKLPILYLLHGHGGNHEDWIQEEEGNVQVILDSLIRNELIPPLVAVTLNAGNSWYVDRHEKMETAYIQEFIPHVESTYAVSGERSNRWIAGNSAGGYGSIRFGMKYPELFDFAILLSPAAYFPAPPAISSSRKIDVFKNEDEFDTALWQQYAYRNLLSNTNSPTKFYISTGDDDAYEIVKVVADVQEFFIQNEIPQELSIINGGHDWNVWRDRFAFDLVRALRHKADADD